MSLMVRLLRVVDRWSAAAVAAVMVRLLRVVDRWSAAAVAAVMVVRSHGEILKTFFIIFYFHCFNFEKGVLCSVPGSVLTLHCTRVFSSERGSSFRSSFA